MESRLEGMIDKYAGLVMVGVMERTFDEGLAAMKEQAESMPPPARTPDLVIEETRVAELHYLGIRDTVDTTSVAAKLHRDFEKVRAVLQKQNLQAVGAPFAIYYITADQDEEELVDSWMPSIKPWRFDACLGIDGTGRADGRVKPGTRPACPAVVAHYFGSYDGLYAAHTAINQYLEKHEKTQDGPPWEEYITRPGQEPDTSKWQTDVYYPVKE
jgi:effector-binding domain-containing protein